MRCFEKHLVVPLLLLSLLDVKGLYTRRLDLNFPFSKLSAILSWRHEHSNSAVALTRLLFASQSRQPRFARVPDSPNPQSAPSLLLAQDEIRARAPSLLQAYMKLSRHPRSLQQLESLSSQLMNFSGYLEDPKQIRRALEAAYLAHYGQFRKSGEPFVVHPVEVACSLSRARFDLNCVIAGLLHDTVEDTDLSFDELQELFDESVRDIVEGETEVSKLGNKARVPVKSVEEFSERVNPENEQAENLRSLFLAIAKDYRVIVVKLADRLHNMRTLEFMPQEKQLNKARETLELYVPLAHRFGLWCFKTKLSDLSFKYIYPRDDSAINDYLQRHSDKHEKAIQSVSAVLKSIIEEDNSFEGYSWQLKHRIKDKYSMYQKMRRRNCTIDAVHDLVAVRLVLKPPKVPSKRLKRNQTFIQEREETARALCYLVHSKLHSVWAPMDGSFKDYIQAPKANGYRSLHSTIKVNDQPLEVQIRTDRMHDEAEYGAAAHTQYKDSSMSEAWKRNIEKFKDYDTPRFVEEIKKDLMRSNIFVTYSDGRIQNFTKGAVVKDVYDELGYNESSYVAFVNGEFGRCTQTLHNNDEIKFFRYSDLPYKTSMSRLFERQFTVFGKDRNGIVKDVWETIAQKGAKIISLAPEVLTPGGPAAIDIKVKEPNDSAFEALLKALEQVKGVVTVIPRSSEDILTDSREGFWANCNQGATTE